MSKNKVEIAKSYYAAMVQKDLNKVAEHLHPDVKFSGPLDQRQGKESLMEAVKGFANFVEEVKYYTEVTSGDLVMFTYDVCCKEPMGVQHAAAKFVVRDGLIHEIELFYDPRPTLKVMGEIFN
ncbi:MAG: nuclear transport factor 2 family protein [Chlamydiia bacterium]|nr:nuclear transport factor 2 family protein [Chlamydiia bacterium]